MALKQKLYFFPNVSFLSCFFSSKLRRCFVLTLANSARDETIVTNSIESFLFVSPHLCVCWSVRTECFVRLITNSDSFFYLNLNSLPCLYLIMFSVVPPFCYISPLFIFLSYKGNNHGKYEIDVNNTHTQTHTEPFIYIYSISRAFVSYIRPPIQSFNVLFNLLSHLLDLKGRF